MVRENNQKYINTHQTEETPKFGAGSAFGKDAKVGWWNMHQYYKVIGYPYVYFLSSLERLDRFGWDFS